MIRYALLFCLCLSAVGLRAAPPPPAEVTERTFVYEIVRNLYRWYLDERDVEAVPGMTNLAVWVQRRTPELDKGDRSEYAELIVPQFAVRVVLKKADYTIEETGSVVKGRGFRMVQVGRSNIPSGAPAGATVLGFPVEDMRNFLFTTRTNSEFPSDALLERLRTALRKKLTAEEMKENAGRLQIVHLAPLSPVSNELWVFHENSKTLIRFTSDIDLTNEEVWEHEQIDVRTYDCFNQVVVSMDEAPGSNEFLTRDRIGRAMYNCIILGRRLEMTGRPASAP